MPVRSLFAEMTRFGVVNCGVFEGRSLSGKLVPMKLPFLVGVPLNDQREFPR